MARPTKLTRQMLERIDYLLGSGCTIEVTCDQAGIDRQTFYNWKAESLHLRDLADRQGNALATDKDVLILAFFDIIRQAQTRAQALATLTITSAFFDRRYTETSTEVWSETRLMKDEKGADVPYTHEEKHTRIADRMIPADWHAGLEFLKRRDQPTWNPPQKVEVTLEEKAISAIQAGEVDFWIMVKKFDDDYEYVAGLFGRAGIPAPPRSGEARNR